MENIYNYTKFTNVSRIKLAVYPLYLTRNIDVSTAVHRKPRKKYRPGHSLDKLGLGTELILTQPTTLNSIHREATENLKIWIYSLSKLNTFDFSHLMHRVYSRNIGMGRRLPPRVIISNVVPLVWFEAEFEGVSKRRKNIQKVRLSRTTIEFQVYLDLKYSLVISLITLLYSRSLFVKGPKKVECERIWGTRY